MKVRDEDPAPAPCPPESMPDPEAPTSGLLRVVRDLQEVSAAFGHMRAFLEAHGLHSVSELDADGRAALVLYLQSVRARIQRNRP